MKNNKINKLGVATAVAALLGSGVIGAVYAAPAAQGEAEGKAVATQAPDAPKAEDENKDKDKGEAEKEENEASNLPVIKDTLIAGETTVKVTLPTTAKSGQAIRLVVVNKNAEQTYGAYKTLNATNVKDKTFTFTLPAGTLNADDVVTAGIQMDVTKDVPTYKEGYQEAKDLLDEITANRLKAKTDIDTAIATYNEAVKDTSDNGVTQAEALAGALDKIVAKYWDGSKAEETSGINTKEAAEKFIALWEKVGVSGFTAANDNDPSGEEEGTALSPVAELDNKISDGALTAAEADAKSKVEITQETAKEWFSSEGSTVVKDKAAADLIQAKKDAIAALGEMTFLTPEQRENYGKQISAANSKEDVDKVLEDALVANASASGLSAEKQAVLNTIIKGNLTPAQKAAWMKELEKVAESGVPALKTKIDSNIKFNNDLKDAIAAVKGMNLTDTQKGEFLKKLGELAWTEDGSANVKLLGILTDAWYAAGDNDIANGKLDKHFYGVKALQFKGAVQAAGLDRYGTAIAVSQRTFPEGARTVVLATGTDFADALTAGPIAERLGAPILLAHGDGFDASTLDEIQRLNPKQIVVVGGTKAISDEALAPVKAKLSSKVVVERFAGETRYGTSSAVLKDFGLKDAKLVVATGENFPDALVAGAVAGHVNGNLVIVDPTAGATTDQVTILKDLKPTETTVVGKVLSKEAVATLDAATGKKAEVVGGKDRFETANEAFVKFWQGGKDNEKAHYAVVATGMNYPDSLVGSVPAIANDAPILLTNNKEVKTYTNAPKNQLLVGYVTTAVK